MGRIRRDTITWMAMIDIAGCTRRTAGSMSHWRSMPGMVRYGCRQDYCRPHGSDLCVHPQQLGRRRLCSLQVHGGRAWCSIQAGPLCVHVDLLGRAMRRSWTFSAGAKRVWMPECASLYSAHVGRAGTWRSLST
jgi:hypothetical protein